MLNCECCMVKDGVYRRCSTFTIQHSTFHTMPEVRDDQLPLGAGTAEEVPPRPAASVIVMRGEPFEVLFLRRTDASTFVPGSWVFPGGTLDDVDREVAASV